MPEVQVPTPEQLADAGPWAVALFVAISFLALVVYLFYMLLKRELGRADKAEAELVATRKELNETKVDRLEATAEVSRLRRLLETYEETDARLRRRPTARRRRDDA